MSTADRPVFTTRPSVVGHRGLGRGDVGGHLENSMSSLLEAVALGVDWVELDVSRTADDQLVVHHNPVSDPEEFLVERTAAQLARHGYATLAEAFDALPDDVGIDLDLKTVIEDAPGGWGSGTVALVAPLLAAQVGRRPLLTTSFDVAALLFLREQVPGLPLGLISWVDYPLRMAVTAAAHLDLDVVCLHHGSFGANRVEQGPVHRPPAYSVEVAHDAGLEVLAWCPDADAVRPLVDAGVDAVCVNDVPEMLPLVRAAAAAAS
jgi:glycerophosphoryl diester phosphodiesterase